MKAICSFAIVLVSLLITGAHAGGVSPAKLSNAGWDCLNPMLTVPPNTNVHCFPPGQLEAIFAGTAKSAHTLTFATSDPLAEEAELLGTERLLRGDKFNGQPCPTDPPGFPGAVSSPPDYDWSWLMPAFGLDYYVCHSFDSPW